MNRNDYIKDLLSKRRNLIEVVFIASLIGVGINLVSEWISQTDFFKSRPIPLLILGILMLLIGFIYFSLRFLNDKDIKKTFKGFVLFDNDSNIPYSCEGYRFSEELSRDMKAAFSENKAMKHLWDTGEKADRNKLLIEATEYFVLDTLSTHLTDYFNLSGLSKDPIEELSRKDIPHILLENRFLELFSKPMDQREQFIRDVKKDDKNKKGKPKGKVVFSMGKGGAIFKDFDLVLPKNSTVKKENDFLLIDTPRFELRYKVIYGTFSTVLPIGYEEYYLNLDFNEKMQTYQIELIISVRFKTFKFLLNKGWNYYEWLDLFIEKVETEFSKRAHLKKIEWNKTYAQARVFENIQKRLTNDIAHTSTELSDSEKEN